MSEYKTANDYVQRWVRANQNREYRLGALREADKELRVSAQELGNFVAPKAVCPGEKFLLWVNGECVGVHGDILLQVEIPLAGEGYLVSWREKESDRFIYSAPESYKQIEK